MTMVNNKSYLPKRPRQIVQTQIRLLLKVHSDQGLPCLYSDKQFENCSPDNGKTEKVLEMLKQLA